jgi:serine/threonine-protein kinase
MSGATRDVKLSDLNYKVVKALGAGAGSTILLVTDQHLGTKYALKVVKRQDADDDIYINQAIHEFDVAGRLNHPSLLKIYDCRVKRRWFKVDGVELLMEYVDGRTLDEVACREVGQLVLVFIHVASALSHMHRRGVYHGDLKPGNIMLSRDGKVKVLDFGTAWIKGQPKDRVQGTPQYMAPEQATERVVDDRTDLYNFGATMYRMFTGEYANLGVPELGDSPLNSRRKAPMALNPAIPGTLNETILRCLEMSPDRRPAGFFEVKDQLVAVARYLGRRPDDIKGSDESGSEHD